LNKKHMERRQKASTSRMSRRMQLLKRRKPGTDPKAAPSTATAAKKAPAAKSRPVKATKGEKTKE